MPALPEREIVNEAESATDDTELLSGDEEVAGGAGAPRGQDADGQDQRQVRHGGGDQDGSSKVIACPTATTRSGTRPSRASGISTPPGKPQAPSFHTPTASTLASSRKT